MALPASFHPEAEVDLAEGVAWYNQKHHGLGAEFAAAVREAVQFASEFPDAGGPLGTELRRVFVKSFPYYVLYGQSSTQLLVTAIAHFRRRPGYWRERA